MPADQPPAWFRAALDCTPRPGAVEVAGARIAFTTWGDGGGAGVVLVHGGAANARWWDHIAPLLATGRRVVALDLSGHGDSDRGADYTLTGWADEVHAVAGAAGIGPRPTVVGHSMGGFVALQAALDFGAALGGIVALDSPVHDVTADEQAELEQRAYGPLRPYPTKDAALARFRPVPEQAAVLPYIARHIATESVVETDAGWTWKFDPAIFRRPYLSPAVLTPLPCRAALFRAEYGRLSQDLVDVMLDRLGHDATVVELPAAGHHMMLDQPLSLVAALRTLLDVWH